MSLVVVGSIALDSIETPSDRMDDALGGSGTHFALASSLLAETRLVGNVGTDFPEEHVQLLRDHGVDLTGMRTCEGKTFRWTGRYFKDMNTRETLSCELNVFGDYPPVVPQEYVDTPFVFLANCAPHHQMEVLDVMRDDVFSVVDTMDHWINSQRDDLATLFKRVNMVVVNDSEVELLSGMGGIAGAEQVLDMGPEYVVMKKGEHGAVMVGKDQTFLIPAFPTRRVVDPTGAGDTFAGGMMGWLARCGEVTVDTLRQAIAYGTVLGSFNVEDFGTRRTAGLTLDKVETRLAEFREMLKF